MGQPWTTNDRDEVHDGLAALIADLPGVEPEESYGHTGYLLRGKRIAWLLVDHHGDGRLALWVKAPRGEQETLIAGEPDRYFVPPYLGPSGWVGVDLAPRNRPGWDEIAALLEQARRMSATKRAVAAYDTERDAT